MNYLPCVNKRKNWRTKIKVIFLLYNMCSTNIMFLILAICLHVIRYVLHRPGKVRATTSSAATNQTLANTIIC